MASISSLLAPELESAGNEILRVPSRNNQFLFILNKLSLLLNLKKDQRENRV